MISVFPQPYPTLSALLDAQAAKFLDKTAYRFLGGNGGVVAELSYRDLRTRAVARAAWLASELDPGDRALLVYPPGLDFIISLFACMYAGVVAVPTFPPDAGRTDRASRRIASIVRDCAPTAILTERQLRPLVTGALADPRESERRRWFETDSETATGEAELARACPVTADSVAMIQYTSGATAEPRGVVLSHTNLLQNQEMIRRAFQHSAETVVVSWLPLYHDMGLIGGVMQPLYAGGSCVLISPLAFLREPYRWLEAIHAHRATTSGAPNFAYDLCVRRIPPERRSELDLASWQVAFNGSEPVQAETMKRFADAFSVAGFRKSALYPCYGLAEATLIVSGAGAGQGALTRHFEPEALARDRVELVPRECDGKALVSAGTVLEGVELAIVDATGGLARPGSVGEIWVRGASVALGYWRRTSETDRLWRATLTGGDGRHYLRTGDLGFVQDGQLFVTGRQKDLIIVRGRNVHPQDIEQAAAGAHACLVIGGSAAFATPDAMGERVVVVQEQRAGTKVAPRELLDSIRRAVAENCHLSPTQVALVKAGSLPKTTSGKIRRSTCREQFLSGELKLIASDATEFSDADYEPATPASSFAAQDGLAGVRRTLEGWLLGTVATIVGRPSGELDVERNTLALGLDSLGATALAARIQAEFSVVAPLEMLFEESPRGIAGWLLGALTRSGAKSSGPGHSSAEGSDALAVAAPPALGEPVSMPVSYMQRAIWFERQLAPSTTHACISVSAQVFGEVDAAALARAGMALVQRHRALRTRFMFRASELEQTIVSDGLSPWYSGPGSAGQSVALQPFDLAKPGQFRISCNRSAADRHELSLVVEHIIADFASCQILLRELLELYQADRQQRAVRLPPLTAEYADFVRAEAELLAGPERQRLLDYWRSELAGLGDPLPLYTDRPRPPVPSYQRQAVDLGVDARLAGAVREAAARHGVTTHTYLLCALYALLHAYTGQSDLVVGSPASCRPDAHFDGVVGCFINPIVLRARLTRDLTFAGLLAQQKVVVSRALAHRQCPFELVVRELGMPHEPSHNSVFQVSFTHYAARSEVERDTLALAFGESNERVGLAGVELGHDQLPHFWHRSDLAFGVADFGAGLGFRLRLEFNSDLFERPTASRMLVNFVELVRSTLGDAPIPLGRLNCLNAAERHFATVELNDSRMPWPAARETPSFSLPAESDGMDDRIAIVSAQGALSYARLRAITRAIAERVRSQKLEVGAPVGICAARSPVLLAAILGILEAGAAYVPLDPEHPRARIERCLSECGARLLFVDDEPSQALWTAFTGTVVPLSRLGLGPASLAATGSPLAQPNPSPPAGALAYIMHTSGSTNQPKGVMVTRRAVYDLLGAVRERANFRQDDVMLAVTTVSFDISVVELLMPLMAGARVVLADGAEVKDGRRLRRLLSDAQVTVMQATPAGFALLCASGWNNEEKIRVLCGGEALSADLAKRLAESPFVLNLYGPTETTIWSTAQRIRADDRVISIGRPLADNRTYLLNDALTPVPIGGIGELYIGGSSVSRGYLAAPALTATRFVPDPFGETGDRLYRTGDFARLLASGVIEFRGRRDGLVKVRGHRVECSEIELALRRHPSVADAAVQAATDHEGQSLQLVAYVELTAACDAAALREHLLQLLPSYIVPSRFRSLAALPRTANGKLDRAALARAPWQDLAAPVETADRHESDPLLDALLDVLCQVLGLSGIRADDNFFDLGAHSLAMAEVHRRLMARIETDFELGLMFRYPTPRLLATRLGRGTEERDEEVDEARERAERQRLSAGEHRLRIAKLRTEEAGNGS